MVGALRDELVDALATFTAEQWGQLGASFAPPEAPQQHAMDPEALLLFTLHLGRYEPRLLDETLDWLALNAHLVSVHRLRGICASSSDRTLADAALDWSTAQQRPRQINHQGEAGKTLEPLFPQLDLSVGELDPHFARHGWSRPLLTRSNKSQPAPALSPIAFAFRLRRLLGVGVRAEIVRALLTIRAARVSSRVITASAGFSQRNVREGLSQLRDAGIVTVAEVADDRLYSIDHGSWASLLGLHDASDLPFHYDWIPALRAITAILAWLARPGLDQLSDYMLGSQAQTLLDEITPDLRYVGVPPEAQLGADQWTRFAGAATAAVSSMIGK